VVFGWVETATDGSQVNDGTTVDFNSCAPVDDDWVKSCRTLTGTVGVDRESFSVEGTFDQRTICFQRMGADGLIEETNPKRFDGTFTDRNTMELSVTSSFEPCSNPIRVPAPSLKLTRDAITGMVLDNGKKPVSAANVRGADPSSTEDLSLGTTEQGGNFILGPSPTSSRKQNPAAPYDLTVAVPGNVTMVYTGLTHGDSTLVADTAPEAAANGDVILNEPVPGNDPVSGAKRVPFSWTKVSDRVYVLDIKPVAPSTAPELRFVTTKPEVNVPVVNPPVPGEVTLLSGTDYECFVDAYGPFKSLDDATVYASDGSSPLAALPLTRSSPRPFSTK
jgi:hypothetical protein